MCEVEHVTIEFSQKAAFWCAHCGKTFKLSLDRERDHRTYCPHCTYGSALWDDNGETGDSHWEGWVTCKVG